MTKVIGGKTLDVKLDIVKPEPSSTGKTLIIGRRKGPKMVGLLKNGKRVYVIACAYIYPDKVGSEAPENGTRPKQMKGKRRS